MEKLFDRLVETIDTFIPASIGSEASLEKRLRAFLQAYAFNVSRQVIAGNTDRYDLICREKNQRVCIELKLKTTPSDIKQFDRYLPKFRDGLIVVCWQATRSMRDIFAQVIEQSPTPIALMELSPKYGIA